MAGHICRRIHDRWGKRVLKWRPRLGKRNVGHPPARWGIDIHIRWNGLDGWMAEFRNVYIVSIKLLLNNMCLIVYQVKCTSIFISFI